MQKIKVNEFISKKQSKDMIFMFIECGNHGHRNEIANLNCEQIKLLLKQNGYDFDELVQECRNFEKSVPFFENFVRSTFEVHGISAFGNSVSIVDAYSDESLMSIDSDGIICLNIYEAKFEEACKLRDNAIKKNSFEKFCAALSKGIASIEAYIQHRAFFWNTHICDLTSLVPLVDNKSNKVSFDDKIKKWFPIMTRGNSFDLNKKTWRHFKELRKVRDDQEIHSKNVAYSVSFKKLVEYLNKFKIGVAGLLVDLHILFKEPIPRSIIRAYFFPEIKYVNG